MSAALLYASSETPLPASARFRWKSLPWLVNGRDYCRRLAGLPVQRGRVEPLVSEAPAERRCDVDWIEQIFGVNFDGGRSGWASCHARRWGHRCPMCEETSRETFVASLFVRFKL